MSVNPVNGHGDADGSGDPLLGELVGGRYRVSHVLGEGGMGVVYAGEHAELGRRVAIKVIRPEVARDQGATERFLREARTASQLGHPNVVDVFDLGRLPDGRPYMVMPLLKGMDCEAMLRERGPQPPERVAEILSGAASGLDAMHAHGLVHRDVKPENLFLTIHDDGGETTKVMDFGLAALQRVGSRLTRVGTILGTPHYMPPECATGEKADIAADVYALAVVAFEMIAGQLPFDGENPTYLLASKMTTDAPKLSELAPQPISPALDALFARALSRQPEERPRSCGTFIAELREAAASTPRAGAIPNGTVELALRFSEPPPPAAATASPGTEPATTGPVAPSAAAESPLTEPPANDPAAPRLDVAPEPVPRATRRRYGPFLGLAVLAAIGVLSAWALTRGGAERDLETAPGASNEVGANPSPPAAEVASTSAGAQPDEPAIAAHTGEASATGEETPRSEPGSESVSEAPAPRPRRAARRPRFQPGPPTGAAPTPPEPAVPRTGPTADEPTATVDEPVRVPSADVARARALTAEGTRLALRGRLPEAIARYRDATLAAPGHAPAWRGLGVAYERLGNAADARRAFERYLRLRPGAADAEEVRARLERL